MLKIIHFRLIFYHFMLQLKALGAGITRIAMPIQQMREAIESTPAVVHEAQESTRMDDNGVNVTEQSVELARNGYQLQYVMQAIASDVATLQAVIRG